MTLQAMQFVSDDLLSNTHTHTHTHTLSFFLFLPLSSSSTSLTLSLSLFSHSFSTFYTPSHSLSPSLSFSSTQKERFFDGYKEKGWTYITHWIPFTMWNEERERESEREEVREASFQGSSLSLTLGLVRPKIIFYHSEKTSLPFLEEIFFS